MIQLFRVFRAWGGCFGSCVAHFAVADVSRLMYLSGPSGRRGSVSRPQTLQAARRGEALHEITNDYGGVLISFPRTAANSSRVVLKGAEDCVEGAKQRSLEFVEDWESMVTIERVIPQKNHRHIMAAKGVNVQGVTSQYGMQIKFSPQSRTGVCR